MAAPAVDSALGLLNMLKAAGIHVPEQDPKPQASSSSHQGALPGSSQQEENDDDADEESEDGSTSSGEAARGRAALSSRLSAGFWRARRKGSGWRDRIKGSGRCTRSPDCTRTAWCCC